MNPVSNSGFSARPAPGRDRWWVVVPARQRPARTLCGRTGLDGRRIISYYDTSQVALKVYDCMDVDCSAGTARVLDGLAAGYEGFRVTAADCLDGTDLRSDSEGLVGRGTDITIRNDGRPVISYLDWTNFSVKVFSCGDARCFIVFRDQFED